MEAFGNNLLMGEGGLMTALRNSGVGGPEAKLAKEAYNNGLDAYRKGDFPAAKNFWDQALAIMPSYLQAQNSLNKLAAEHPEVK